MATSYAAIPVGMAVPTATPASQNGENVATATPVEVEDNNRFNWMAKTILGVTVLLAVATVYWVIVGWKDMTNVTFKWEITHSFEGNSTA